MASLLFFSLVSLVGHAESNLRGLYETPTKKIIEAAMKTNPAWDGLQVLCTQYPKRITGSKNLEDSIDWLEKNFNQHALLKAWKQVVPIEPWERGAESLEMIEPESIKLTMLGLGKSIGTPRLGIEAEVVSVTSFQELTRIGNNARGKILLYNVPFNGYGNTVQYRVRGASEAAKFGAVAALVRSVGSGNPDIAHTGMLHYAAGSVQIPAAAVSHSSADRMQAWLDKGKKLVVRLKMEAHTAPRKNSHNLIVDLSGSSEPEKILLIGGHIDSWDVGQGAQDDGSGVMATGKALELIASLIQKSEIVRPRRTLRLVLFTNEEAGTDGAKVYASWAAKQASNHVGALEMDMGAETLTGYGLTLPKNAKSTGYDLMREVTQFLKPLGGSTVEEGKGDGADIEPLMQLGVPGINVQTVGTRYFDWHHSDEDTLQNVNSTELQKHTAALAALSYVLADMPQTLAQ